MTCEHRWRALSSECAGFTTIRWQTCAGCGARRYVGMYTQDGETVEEAHPWPEHVPDAVARAMAKEAVDHPDHYRKDTGHEAIDVIEAWGLGFCLGNALKYIARCGHKGDEVEDLEKARWYIEREIERRRRA